MSASRTPVFSPSPLKPSARLTAVVDLPTPPFPEATAMIDLTPGGAAAACGPAAAAGPPGAARPGGAPPDRSAVSATRAEVTPGMAHTAVSAALRTASQFFTTAASTVIEKNTLPSLTTISDRVAVCG